MILHQPRSPKLFNLGAPKERVGPVLIDRTGAPVLQLLQFWACRKPCSACNNAHCRATVADGSNTYHQHTSCRDCKRQKGREDAAAALTSSGHDCQYEHSASSWSAYPTYSGGGNSPLGTTSHGRRNPAGSTAAGAKDPGIRPLSLSGPRNAE